MSDESSTSPDYDDDTNDKFSDPERSADNPPLRIDDQPEDDGRKRPTLPVIIGSVLLLAVIGAGLAWLIPSGPVREFDQLDPTAPAVSDASGTGGTDVPTALPLAQPIGTYTSTEVIAQVGGAPITRGDFVRAFQPGSDPNETLDQLIQIELVVQAAATEGVTADEAVVTTRIAEIKQTQAGGDEAQFQLLLDQAQVVDEAELRRLLLRDEVIQAMILRHTTAEQAHARHILLSTDGMSETAQLEQVKQEAEALLSQLQGGADFATLASEHSDDPGSAQEGGDLGWALRGVFVEPFDEAVFSMSAGELRLVQSDFGWHIIQLIDAPEVRPLENADLLQTTPGQQAFSEIFLPWIEGLQQAAETNQSIVRLIPTEQLVSQP